METSTPQITELETLLLSYFESKQLDLTHDGQLSIEKMSSPANFQKQSLSYYIHSAMEGSISAQLNVSQKHDQYFVNIEINIKKFLRPQLGMSSAHIAVLIHYIKGMIQRLRVGNEKTGLTWSLDRVQRRFKCSIESIAQLKYLARLLFHLSQVVLKGNKLSLEVVMEEAEYYKAIERWEYARRAYFTWHAMSQLSWNDFQDFLAILQRLRDWNGCVQLLEDGLEKFEGALKAKLAHAACLLCSDVLLDLEKATNFNQISIELDPDNTLYLSTKSDLGARKVYQKQSKVTKKPESALPTIDQATDQSKNKSFTDSEVFDDQDAFFDDLSSITSDSHDALDENSINKEGKLPESEAESLEEVSVSSRVEHNDSVEEMILDQIEVNKDTETEVPYLKSEKADLGVKKKKLATKGSSAKSRSSKSNTARKAKKQKMKRKKKKSKRK